MFISASKNVLLRGSRGRGSPKGLPHVLPHHFFAGAEMEDWTMNWTTTF